MTLKLTIQLLCTVTIINMVSMSLITAASVNNSPIGLQSYTHKIQANEHLCAKELSGLTYNSDSDLLIAIGDSGMLLEWRVTKRMLDSEYSSFNCSSSNPIPEDYKFNDTEAIVHIGGNKYAILEEGEARMSFVKFGTATSTVDFPGNATYTLETSSGTIPSCDDHGLEGLAYDKTNADFYTIKQTGTPELFTFRAYGSPGTVTMTSIAADLTSIIPSLPIESLHGIHYDDVSGNLLIIGTIGGDGNSDHGDNDRVLIELTTAGTYVGHLDLENDLPNVFMDESTHNIEGITMIGEIIILVGEGPTGNADSKMYYLSKSPVNKSPINLQDYTHKILADEHLCVKELSGLTYNSDSDLFMAIGDAGMLLEWNVSKRVLDSQSNNANCSSSNSTTQFFDTEAIVHLGCDKYAIMEEREAIVSFVTIDATTSIVNFPANATYNLETSPGALIPSCDNYGLEGLAYDKTNADFYTIKQGADPDYPNTTGSPELFTFKTPGNNGTVLMNSIADLTNVIPSLPIESVHGLHFDADSGNLLVIGTIGNITNDHGDNDRVLIELTTTGTYVSHLDLENDFPNVFVDGSSHNIEGITMLGDQIVLVGEGPDGNADSKMFYLGKSAVTKSPIALQSYKYKILADEELIVEELSGLTYNSDSDLMMAISDAGKILEWGKTERSLNTQYSGSNCNNSNQLPVATIFNDTEAIVHLSCNKYAIMEEREARVSFVTIDATTSFVNFPTNATIDLQYSNSIPSCTNEGLEGLAYDKTNADFYTIKQAYNPELYTFKTNGSSGTVTMTLVKNLTNIVPSLTIKSVSGIHYDDGSGNLLIIGTVGNSNFGNNDRILIEVTTAGSYVSHLDLEGDLPLQFEDESSHNIEGITMIGDLIILVGEGPSSSSDSKMYYLAKTDAIALDIKVFLEGCYDELSGTMKTDLFDKEVLPGQTNNPNDSSDPIYNGQPYDVTPFNYNGTEGNNWAAYQNNMVDWVLVAFRKEADDQQFLSIAGILQNDGQIIFPYDNPRVLKLTDFPSSFFITIQHRNHLMIMSECSAISLGSLSIEQDFTAANSYKNGATGQKDVINHFCMAAGDMDKLQNSTSGDINGQDKAYWLSSNGVFNIYSRKDANMNADINGDDKILWSRNNGLFNAVIKL